MPQFASLPQDLVDALARDLRRRQALAALEAAGFRLTPLPGAESAAQPGPPPPDLFALHDPDGRPGQLEFRRDGGIALRDARGAENIRWYDAEGRLLRQRDAAGVEIAFQDSAEALTYSRRASPDAPPEIWRIDKDALGQPAQMQRPDGAQSAVLPLAPQVAGLPDPPPGAWLQGLRHVDGTLAARCFDAEGHQIGAIDPRGATTRFREDPAGLWYERISPMGRIDRWEMDPKGRLAAWLVNGYPMARAEGEGPAGAPRRIDWAGGRFAEFTLADGAVTEARAPGSLLGFERDGAARLVAESQDGARLTYGRDGQGRLVSITLPDGLRLGFGYDAAGLLAQVTDWGGGVTRLGWLASGQIGRIQHPNGRLTRIEADSCAAILALSHGLAAADAQPLYAARYSRDAQGRIAQMQDHHGRQAFRYDGLGRLVAVAADDRALAGEWQLDACGNRNRDRGQAFGADADQQIFGPDALGLRHDGLGRLAQMRLPNGRAGRLSHDGRGQLQRIDFADGGLAEYGYDAFGRRSWKRVDGRVTRFLWSGQCLISEIRDPGPGWLRRDHLFLPDLFLPLALRIDGQIYRLHCDARGAVIAATDRSGAPAWGARLTAFGEALVDLAAIDQPWRLANHYLDAESGLHYNLARHYHPGLGRYTSEDPACDPATRGNPYLYAAGDPINRADPSGEIVIPAVLVAAAVGGAVGAVTGAAMAAYETRGQDWAPARWRQLARGALVGGVGGAIGGAAGALALAAAGAAGAAGGTATLASGAGVGAMAGGAIEGAVSAVAQGCAERGMMGEPTGLGTVMADGALGAGLGAVSGGIGGLAARRLRQLARRRGWQRITAAMLEGDPPQIPQHNAGPHCPRFDKWLANGDQIHRTPQGHFAYSTTVEIDGKARLVTVEYPGGYPDFRPYADHPSGVRAVAIDPMTGRNSADFRAANQAAGHPEWGSRSPEGWTWHHDQDGKTMRLIRYEIHDAFSHRGGAAQARKTQ